MEKIIAKSELVVRETDEVKKQVESDLQVPDPSRSVAKAMLEDVLEQEADDEGEENTSQD